jgi:hypothetical protein
MKKSRLTEDQIMGILQDHQTGAKCAMLCGKALMRSAPRVPDWWCGIGFRFLRVAYPRSIIRLGITFPSNRFSGRPVSSGLPPSTVDGRHKTASGWSLLPDPQCSRRADQGMPALRGRHLDLWPEGGARVDDADRAAREAPGCSSAKTTPSSLQMRSWTGSPRCR